MWWVYYKLHALIIGGVRGLATLLARSVGRFLLAVWLLINEEARRYIGLTVWGVVLVLLGKATLSYIPKGEVGMLGIQADIRTPLLIVNLGLLAIWAAAVKRATKITRRNSLEKQRRNKAMRELAADVKGTRQSVNDKLATWARGTPLEGAWSSNRSAREEERAAAERAAKQAEAERATAEEQARRDRISEAERERHLEKLGAEHNPFE